jgi:hypothetical protein
MHTLTRNDATALTLNDRYCHIADAVKLPARAFRVVFVPMLVKAPAGLVRRFRSRLVVGGGNVPG